MCSLFSVHKVSGSSHRKKNHCESFIRNEIAQLTMLSIGLDRSCIEMFAIKMHSYFRPLETVRNSCEEEISSFFCLSPLLVFIRAKLSESMVDLCSPKCHNKLTCMRRPVHFRDTNPIHFFVTACPSAFIYSKH